MTIYSNHDTISGPRAIIGARIFYVLQGGFHMTKNLLQKIGLTVRRKMEQKTGGAQKIRALVAKLNRYRHEYYNLEASLLMLKLDGLYS